MTNTKELPPEQTPMQAIERRLNAWLAVGVMFVLVGGALCIFTLLSWLSLR
jgi:hypothetical protein